MSELVFEGGPEAAEEFDRFAREHPEYAVVETSSGNDGASIIALIVEHSPALSASIALLVGALQRRTIKVKASRDGVELDLSDAAKTS